MFCCCYHLVITYQFIPLLISSYNCVLKQVKIGQWSNLSVGFKDLPILKRRNFSLRLYIWYIEIGRWRNYHQFPRPFMFIWRIFIIMLLFVLFIFIHIYLLLTLLLIVLKVTQSCFPLKLFGQSSNYIIYYLVYIDVRKILGRYYYLFKFLVYILWLLYFYINFVSSSILKNRPGREPQLWILKDVLPLPLDMIWTPYLG